VVLEVLEEGLRIFLNLDLRLNDLGRDVDRLVVGLWVVVSLSLLDPNLDLVRNRLEGFREKDLGVGLGEVVVGSSSEVVFSCASCSISSGSGVGWSLRLLARREKSELSEASDLELDTRDLRGELDTVVTRLVCVVSAFGL